MDTAKEPLAQARIAYQAGDVETAIGLFRRAAQLPDTTPTVLLELADALWANFEFTESLHTLEVVAGRLPTDPQPALLAAKRFYTLGRWTDSATWIEKALARRPADFSLRRMLAELRDREGKLAEAEALARETLAASPGDAQAARALAHTLRRLDRLDEAEVILSRHLTDHPGPDDWRLNYELAACLDRTGDYAGAIAALGLAKTQLRPVADPLLKQWQARAVRREAFAIALDRVTLERWRTAAGPHSSLVPLAILAGHPRSGTTLLEQMLASHSSVVTTDETGLLRSQFIEPIVLGAASVEAALGEVNGFDTEQIEAGRAIYFRGTTAHLGEPLQGRLLIEKDPLATQDLGFMLRLLPEASVIFPLRDPRDVAVSFFFTLVPLNADSAPAADLASTCASVALSLRLWRHWRDVIPQRWAQVRYERLVREPEAELRPLAEVLRLAWEPAVLAPVTRTTRGVRSPTYGDVAQPLYARAIGRWRNYAPWLEPHLAALQPYLQEFGYE